MPRLLPLAAALLLLGGLAACDDEPTDPAQTEVVPEADVERFRADVFLETLDIDADLARFESEVAVTDSAVQVAYGPALDRLRDERRRLQVRVDSLQPRPRAVFDSTRAAVLAQAQALRASVRRARYEAAPTFAALQGAAGRALARLDARLAAAGPAAGLDTTGALRRDLDSLAADRGRLAARIGAYPDTSDAQFARFRAAITDAIIGLETRAEAVVPDTAATARPDTPPDA